MIGLSVETQKLLDRAALAIEHAVELRSGWWVRHRKAGAWTSFLAQAAEQSRVAAKNLWELTCDIVKILHSPIKLPSREGAVTAYRIYVVDESGHGATPPHIVMCDDDDQATQHARQHYLDGKPIEVWDEARCVARLAPTHGK